MSHVTPMMESHDSYETVTLRYTYSEAKTHRMPYLYMSFSTKEPYN